MRKCFAFFLVAVSTMPAVSGKSVDKTLLRTLEYKNLSLLENFLLKEIAADEWDLVWKKGKSIKHFSTSTAPKLNFAKLFRDMQRDINRWEQSKCKSNPSAELTWNEVDSKTLLLCDKYMRDRAIMNTVESQLSELNNF